MRLAIKVMSKSVLLPIGFAGVQDLIVIIFTLGVGAECVPTVKPFAVFKLLVSCVEAVHYFLCFVTLGKVAACLGAYDGVELYGNLILDVNLNEKRCVPKRILFSKLGVNKIKVTLTVNYVTAHIFLVASNAVAMLCENYVCAVVNHSAAEVVKTG